MSTPPSNRDFSYSHVPLLEGAPSIRVLCILSGPNEPINCTLHVLNLNTKPVYDCLSYTWGDPLYHALSPPSEIERTQTTDDSICPITCDKQTFLVTANLLAFLMESRKHGFPRQPLLWIDSICINQNEISERNSQVAMMGKIYEMADQVIIWLGISDFPTEPALDVMHMLAKIPRERYRGLKVSDLEDEELYEKLGIPIVEEQQWRDYAAFLQRTWFSRIWVVQEAFMPEHIVVLCGEHLLNWDDFTACAKFLGDTGIVTLMVLMVTEAINLDASKGVVSVDNTLNNQYTFQHMKELAKLQREGKGHVFTLEKLLSDGRLFNATDKRDHVFALLGIWEKGLEGTGKKVPEDMKPNYNDNTSEVYTKAAWETIYEMGDLNVLSLVENASFRSEILKEQKLPSWVPDYSVACRPYPLAGNPRSSSKVTQTQGWNASSGLSWSIPSPKNTRFLPVEGINFDTISSTAATLSEILGNEFQFHTLLKVLHQSLTSNAPYPDANTENHFEAFWRTLIKDRFQKRQAGEEARSKLQIYVADRVWELRIAVENATTLDDPQLPRFRAVLKETLSLITTLASHPLNKALIPNLQTIDRLIDISNLDRSVSAEKRDIDRDYDDYHESFRSAYSGRRLFGTGKGYLGIVAQDVEVGDTVWVVAGCRVPVVLRRRDSGVWRLVGEAFVKGVMGGEVVERGGGGVESVRLE